MCVLLHTVFILFKSLVIRRLVIFLFFSEVRIDKEPEKIMYIL